MVIKRPPSFTSPQSKLVTEKSPKSLIEINSCQAFFHCNFTSSMAKQTSYLISWIEVAPALVISPLKTSNSPSLDTISEEETEEYEDL
ncbi:hypothetical protein AB3S75_031172 [Citrus x aurantiifolia]